MLSSIIVFGVKVYVYGKLFDAIEAVGKGILAKVAINDLQRKKEVKKGGNEQIVETYFVD